MYKLIEWPKIQELMDKSGFDENACLANDFIFLGANTNNTSSAYFVDVEWLNKHMTTLEVIVAEYTDSKNKTYWEQPDNEKELQLRANYTKHSLNTGKSCKCLECGAVASIDCEFH